MTNKQKIAELETKLRRYEKRAGDLLLRVLRTRGFCLTIFPARRNWLVAAILKLLVDIIQLFKFSGRNRGTPDAKGHQGRPSCQRRNVRK